MKAYIFIDIHKFYTYEIFNTLSTMFKVLKMFSTNVKRLLKVFVEKRYKTFLAKVFNITYSYPKVLCNVLQIASQRLVYQRKRNVSILSQILCKITCISYNSMQQISTMSVVVLVPVAAQNIERTKYVGLMLSFRRRAFCRVLVRQLNRLNRFVQPHIEPNSKQEHTRLELK